MQRPTGRHNTLEDYFAIEESSPIKHEYFDGEIFAMAGASLRHNRIARNLLITLSGRLEMSDCEAFGSDLRLRTPSGLLTYPDVTLICGRVELSPMDRLDTVLNPIVIVEVLSESTKDYDRGEKSRLYYEIPALRAYVLVEQARMSVEVRSAAVATSVRLPRAWTSNHYTEPHEAIELKSLGVHLTVGEIYAGVDFSTDDPK